MINSISLCIVSLTRYNSWRRRFEDFILTTFGKLISLGDLLVRKVTWFVLTSTSATLILSHAFGADRMTKIAYIYSRLPRTHSLTFWLPETTLSLFLSILTYRDSTLFLSSFRRPETAWPCQLVRHNSIRVYIFNLFLSCSAFSVRLVLASNTASDVSSNP